MKGLKAVRLTVIWIILLTCTAAVVNAQQWQPAQRLDFTTDMAVKTPRIYPASTGGFHAMYKPTSPGWSIIYRRYQSGMLGPGRLVHALSFLGGTNDICEAGNGDIWITWENWDESAPNPGEQIWAAKSADNGLNWTKYALTNYWYNQKSDGTWEGGQAKNPQIAPYGLAGSSTVVSCTHRASENRLKYGLWDGSTWTPSTDMGPWTDNFYASVGVCRSLADGSVYRTYGRESPANSDTWQIYYRRFNGTGWEPEVQVSSNASGPFASRPSIAVSTSGQILVVWDQNETVLAKWYKPGYGWSPQMTVASGWCASVTAVPGGDDFYAAYTENPNSERILGKRFRNGGWDSIPAVISVGVPSAFSLDVDICADVDGQTLYACWEWHGGDNPPHAYYAKFTYNDSTPPTTPIVNDTGATTDQADRLKANWTSSDTESSVVEYQYSIGTSKGATNVVGWTSTGLSTSVEKTGLSLVPGTSYYFNVKAKNGVGLWSAAGSSDGITCTSVANTVVFNSVEIVSTATDAADGPMLSKSADGGMHLVYRDNNYGAKQIAYRKHTSAGWTDTEYTVTGIPNVDYPDVAEDPMGTVHCTYAIPGYRENNDVMESIRSAGSWLYPANITNNNTMDWYPRIVGGAGANLLHLISNGDGSTYSVKHSLRTASGWGSLTTISSGGSERYGNPDAAVDPSGNVLAVWSKNDTTYGRIKFSKWNGTTWSSPIDIKAVPGDKFYDPRIAIGPNGLAHVVFRGNNIGGDPDPTIYYMKQTTSSSWGSAAAVASGYWVTIAVDQLNRPHIVYGKTAASAQRAVCHKYNNGAAWSTEQTIGTNTLLDAPHPIIRADVNGNMHVAWDDMNSGVRRILYRNTIPADATPATTPVVTDQGAYTQNTTSIAASWSSSDPESGIVEYQYAVGTTSGGTEVKDWTSTGTTTSATASGLSLINGSEYYVSVKARNGANLWSDIGSSDGITVVSSVKSAVKDTQSLPDGTAVALTTQTVTGSFGGFFYVEDADRTSGIKVVSGESVSVGQLVSVAGKLETVGGERQVTASSVDLGTTGHPVPAPMGMSNKALGGASVGYASGVPGASGLYNVGLLITTCGRVLSGGGNWFIINDGSGPVKVYSVEIPSPGSYVAVTGISSIEGSQKVLRVRNLPNQVRTL